MPDFLKGNYKLNSKYNDTLSKDTSRSLTEEFEEQALAKLGGSICFVAKSKSLIWDGDSSEASDK